MAAIVQRRSPVENGPIPPEACGACRQCREMNMPGCLGHYPDVSATVVTVRYVLAPIGEESVNGRIIDRLVIDRLPVAVVTEEETVGFIDGVWWADGWMVGDGPLYDKSLIGKGLEISLLHSTFVTDGEGRLHLDGALRLVTLSNRPAFPNAAVRA